MPTIIIGAIVFIVIGFAAYSIYRSKKKGKGCDGCCAGCDKSKNCH